MSLDALAAATAGCSLAELSGVCREAALVAMREDLSCEAVGTHHVRSALARHGCWPPPGSPFGPPATEPDAAVEDLAQGVAELQAT